MIDVKELRIGNIVQHKLSGGPQFLYVAAIDEEGVTLKGDSAIIVFADPNNIEPVPLSESLLIDSGFWHIEFRDKWQLDGFGFQLEDPERNDKSDGYGLLYGLVGHEFQRIKYLHQLQNLYFALTGKELPIKK